MKTAFDIYRNGEVIVENIPITSDSLHKATLMREDYIKVAFSDVVNYGFKSGDYILVKVEKGTYISDASGVIFALAEDYYPTMENESVYKYELQFNAPWYNLNNYLCLFLTETPINGRVYVTRRESDWEFTGTAAELLGIIIKNTQLVGLYDEKATLLSTRDCPCQFSSLYYCEPTEVKSFSFSSTDVISVLNQMSNTFELEWWVERSESTYIIHFGECDNSIIYDSFNSTQFNPDGTRMKDASLQTALTMGENISKPSVKQNDAMKRYYFVYGSSRNIDQSITSLDVNALATKRLSLDNPIDKKEGSGEEVVIFEDIYPKSDYQVTRVDSYETQSETIIGYDGSGNPIYATYTIYQVYLKAFSDMVMNLIKTNDDVQNIEDIVASGKTLSVKFISHTLNGTTITPLLAGWEFEVGAVLKTDTNGVQWYELQLLHQDINNYIVPNENLCPKGVENGTATDINGNKTTISGVGSSADWVCVFNIKGAYIDTSETSGARAELQEAFDKYYANKKKNISYSISPYVNTNINLELGDAVRLKYGSEEVITRVNSFSKHLDYLIDATYELCAYTNKGAVNSLKEDVKVLNAVVNRIDGGGGGVNINAVSDLILSIGNKRYLRKTTKDTAEKEITFNEGIEVNGKGVVANGDGVTATKIAANKGDIKQVTADKVTSESIESADYNSEFTGFTLKNTEDGSYLEVDKLNVRKKAVFRELDIKKIDHIGGANVTSPASCKIDAVDLNFPAVDLIDANGKKFYAADGYKCYFNATDGDKTIHNEWKVGDQALCHAFNLTTPRYYWRLVTAVSVEPIDGFHCVVLSMSDCDTDSDVPMAEDTIVCFGNRTDKDRQSVIIMDSEGASAPYLRQLKGINSYNISDANIVTQLSPTKNIIRGETIELSTSSGNKGVQDLANDALNSAKTYTDTAFGNAKKYTDTSFGSAKEYADGVLGSAKEYADGVLDNAKGYADGVGSSALTNAKTYADGVGSSTLNNAKTYADGVGTSTLNSAKTYADGVGDEAEANAKEYADGVGTSVTTSVKGYADGLFADSKNYTQEREAYLQSQITANANGIGLCATKTELKTVSDGVDTLATRVTEAEASIKVNADGITALAEKTEVDITKLGTRISQAEASIKVNADNIALKASKTDLESVKNSVGGLNTRLTTAESKISQNADAIALKASKTELTSVSNAVGGLTNRVAAAESQIEVNAEGIASTVERINAIVEDVSMDDFTNDTIQYYSVYDGLMMSYNDGTDRNFRCSINLGARKKGDVIRITNPDGIIAYILACDGDTAAAQALVTKHNVNITDKTLLGVCLQASGNEYVSPITYTPSIEMVLEQDAPIVFIQIKDNYRGKWKNSTVTIISERYSAQTRIEQSADNIRLQVGQAGINLDTQNITLTASKTTINGDLAVGVVKCYYDEAKTQLRSAYNGNGDGTIVYYYPNGQVMRQDSFVTDTSGNVLGMRTTYYKADGSVAWVLSEGGIQTTLSDYWEAINGGNALAYTDSIDTMMDICKQYLGEAMRAFSESQFSRFVSQSGNFKAYNGKVAKGLKSGEKPDSVTLYSGVLVYSIELVEDGVMPVYQVAYEQVTTALNQLSLIMTKKFNSLGEIN